MKGTAFVPDPACCLGLWTLTLMGAQGTPSVEQSARPTFYYTRICSDNELIQFSSHFLIALPNYGTGSYSNIVNVLLPTVMK